MVSFSCEVCNDTLLKKKLMAHFNRCPQAYFTCIDCNTTFEGMDFQKHTQCITEDQKYQGKLYKPKEKPVSPALKPAVSEPKETKKEKKSKSSKDAKDSQKEKIPSTKPSGVLKVKKSESLDKVLKSLAKSHNLDKKQLLKSLKLTPDGNLEWC